MKKLEHKKYIEYSGTLEDILEYLNKLCKEGYFSIGSDFKSYTLGNTYYIKGTVSYFGTESNLERDLIWLNKIKTIKEEINELNLELCKLENSKNVTYNNKDKKKITISEKFTIIFIVLFAFIFFIDLILLYTGNFIRNTFLIILSIILFLLMLIFTIKNSKKKGQVEKDESSELYTKLTSLKEELSNLERITSTNRVPEWYTKSLWAIVDDHLERSYICGQNAFVIEESFVGERIIF